MKRWCESQATRLEDLVTWAKTRLRKAGVKPRVVVLEDRFLPSVLAGNAPQPPAAIVSVETSQLAAAETIIDTVQQLETREAAVLLHEVQTIEAHMIGFLALANPLLASWLQNSANNATAPQSSGSGSGGDAMNTGHEGESSVSPQDVTRVKRLSGDGAGSGSGSSSASVSGEVWLDSDDDGLLNNNESGLSGITVNLDDAAGQVLLSTTTDAYGIYVFSVSPALVNEYSGSGSGGGFEVQVVIPSGDTATLENVSGSGTNSNINSSGYSEVFSLSPGGAHPVNAGLVPPPATVNGEVWYDSNGDGLLDNGESGVSGVTVNLDNASGQVLLTTTTNASGNYQFTVPPSLLNSGSGSGSSSSSGGSFEIQVVIPSNEVATLENAYGSGINSNINGYGDSALFALSFGGNQQVNAGFAAQPVVSGEVWYDSNGDGLLDNSESGMSGVTVNLDNAAGQMLMTTTTNANGNYQFSVSQSVLNQVYGSGSGSGPGNGFEIQVVIPSGDVATREDIIGSGINSKINAQGYSNVFSLFPAGSQQINAGLVARTATLTGEVWLDSNGDGLLDNSESGMSGITVNLDNAQGVMLQSTSTDANGNYSFNVSLASGSGSGGGYEIQVVYPSGDTATGENASGTGIKSNIDAGGYSNLIWLYAGTSQQVNAGLVAQSGSGSDSASVSGEVWLDNNGDGTLDDGEMGFSGITVNLLNSTGHQVMTTTTDPEGDYDFSVGVGSGSGSGSSYQIQVVLPVGDEATIQGPDSDIDANGLSPVFALIAGGAEDDKAGLRSTVVNTTQDDPNGALGGNKVTLRDAIQTVINGLDKPVTFTVNGTINLQKSLPVLSKNITIDGSGAAITVHGNGNAAKPYQIFDVAAGTTVEINDLTISGGFDTLGLGGGIINAGNLTLEGDSIASNQTTGDGGGIYNRAGANLIVSDVFINENTAQGRGGGLANFGSVSICCGSQIDENHSSKGGGGIYNALSSTITTENDSTINGNFDDVKGAGVYNLGTFIMHGGSISGNIEQLAGGGLFNDTGKVTLDSSATLQGNQAFGGDGIYVNSGSLTLTGNVTIAYDNYAKFGGGMFIDGGKVTMSGGSINNNTAWESKGGGILVSSGTLTLTNVTIHDNTAKLVGGGVCLSGGTVKINGGGINNNSAKLGGGLYVSAGSLTINSGLIYGNTIYGGVDGGGLYIEGGTVTIAGGSIENNTAVNNGGGIYNDAGTLTLRNGVFIGTNNNTGNQGGGMYLGKNSTTRINLATVDGNEAQTGQGIYEQKGAQLVKPGLTDDDDPGGTPVTGA